jgi:SAM-dependent methyltransferase
MAHPQQQNFCLKVKEKFPNYFKDTKIFDVGSLDINGTNHFLFEGDYKYIGVDLIEGKNVDFVCRGHEYDTQDRFDVSISTECFEHDEFWKESFDNMYRLLKSGGLLLFTCAHDNRGEHGTSKSRPEDAPAVAELNDYYGNLNEQKYKEKFNFDEMFSEYHFEVDYFVNDLYFYGIKK